MSPGRKGSHLTDAISGLIWYFIIILCADKSESVVKYTLPEDETQIFASKYKLYLPSEEELIQELNQEYQALEAGKAAKEK